MRAWRRLVLLGLRHCFLLKFVLYQLTPRRFSLMPTSSRFIGVPSSLGPGYLQNHNSHAIVESIDLYPTLADLGGLALPSEVRPDAGNCP